MNPQERQVFWHDGLVSREDRIASMKQRGCTIWLTGLSGSGKSTIARELEKMLLEKGRFAYVLDGDNVRHGLNKDLGFSPDDRSENIRRIGEVARLFCDANLITITAFISPYKRDRDMVRALHEPGEFIEVFVDCPLNLCESRDPKGLYAKARAGELTDMTGIDAPYEAPDMPELTINTEASSSSDATAAILEYLEGHDYLL